MRRWRGRTSSGAQMEGADPQQAQMEGASLWRARWTGRTSAWRRWRGRTSMGRRWRGRTSLRDWRGGPQRGADGAGVSNLQAQIEVGASDALPYGGADGWGGPSRRDGSIEVKRAGASNRASPAYGADFAEPRPDASPAEELIGNPDTLLPDRPSGQRASRSTSGAAGKLPLGRPRRGRSRHRQARAEFLCGREPPPTRPAPRSPSTPPPAGPPAGRRRLTLHRPAHPTHTPCACVVHKVCI